MHTLSRLSHMHFADALQPVIGFVTAAASSGLWWLAQTVDATQTRGWMEMGGTLGFIGGLSFGCVTLWKELQVYKREMAELNKEIRGDWKAQNDKLIAVLEKLDPDT